MDMTDKSNVWSSGTQAEHEHADDGVDVPYRQWNRGESGAIF